MRKQGFTILELLIALSISSFVILGMLQGYRNVSNMIDRSRNLMVLNRKICLFFNQLERDLSSSFIPFLNTPVHPELSRRKPEEGKKEASTIKPIADKDKEKEDQKNYFVGEILPDFEEKIKGKRRELFKSLNFITTNALRIYSEKRVMLVRVMYELVKDKEKSRQDKIVYNLLRRETTDLENFKFKEDDSIIQRDKKSDIKTYLIVDNVKNLFVEYIADQSEALRQAQGDRDLSKKKSVFAKEEVEKTRLFIWGNTKETENLVPEMVDVFITFWDEKLEKESSFECLIPISSYPTQKPSEEKPGDQRAKPEQKLTQPGQKGVPPATPVIPKPPQQVT
ncbi:MAG: prepilin-type N-terminal cleavage/methylation domain-containing protein [bacterium]